MKRILAASLAVLFVGLSGPAVQGQEAAGKSYLTITSDRLQTDEKNQVAVFTGNVVAVDKEMTVTSRKLTIHYAGNETKEVRKVVAEENVVIVQPKHKSYSDVAIYIKGDNTLELIGKEGRKARIDSGTADRLEGKRIFLYLDENNKVKRTEAEGSQGGRVHLRFEQGGGAGKASSENKPASEGDDKGSEPSAPPPPAADDKSPAPGLGLRLE